MIATREAPVKQISKIRKLETRLEEAHDTYYAALNQLRLAERQGRWEDAREWRSEIAGVEKDIASLTSQIDSLTDDGQDQAQGGRGWGAGIVW